MSFAPKFAFWFASWATIAAVGILVPNYMPQYFRYITISAGLFLMFYGLLLNAIAGRTLRIYGHFDIRRGIRRPEKIVKIGIYSCMRHPAQFGSAFFGVGIALITSNIYAILLSGWFFSAALYFMMAIEERETLKIFGSEYAEFIRDRKPFTFSFKCLIRGIRALKSAHRNSG